MGAWKSVRQYGYGVEMKKMEGGGNAVAIFDEGEKVTETTQIKNKADWQAQGYVEAKKNYQG